jgi:hypothetical protein
MNSLTIFLLSSLPTPSPALTQTVDLGTLTYQQAKNLDGKAVRVRYTVAASDCREGLAEAAGKPGLLRCVQVGSLAQVPHWNRGTAYEAEGVLRLRHHPERTIDGKRFEAVLEVRVEDAMPTVQED